MKLFGFNLSLSRNQKSKIETQKSLSPEAAAWLRGEDTGSQPGTTLANAYEQSVWVYRAINVLAEQVANIPFLFSIGERGRENLITSGPLLDFYAHPNPQVNRFQYWELRVIWLMLRGECFRIPIYEDAAGGAAGLSPSHRGEGRGEGELAGTLTYPLTHPPTHSAQRSTLHAPRSHARRLKRVLILDPAHFQHIIENGELIGWRYTGLGPNAPLESQVFLPEEVWFEKLPNPFDCWRGLPPLYVAGMATKTDFAAGAFMQGLMENNADAGLIVRSEQQLDEQQREQIKATIRNRKRGGGVADRPIYLWGVTEIIQPSLSSADLQFLENRKFSRGEICAAFGIPEEIVTITDNAKYDVMAGSRLNFIENRVAPLCTRLEAEEDATVKALDPRATGWFDIDSLPLMQAARRDRLDSAKTGFDMGIPFNELNRVFDLGFKPLPWGNTGYLPSKLTKAGQLPSP